MKIIVLVFFVLSASIFGQLSFKISGNYAIPSEKVLQNAGFGSTLQAEIILLPKIRGTLSVGYLHFSGDERNILYYGGAHLEKDKRTYVPILIGSEFSLIAGLFASVEFGAIFSKFNTTTTILSGYPTFGEIVEQYESEYTDTRFCAALGCGYRYQIIPLIAVNVNAKYQLISELDGYFNSGIGLEVGL